MRPSRLAEFERWIENWLSDSPGESLGALTEFRHHSLLLGALTLKVNSVFLVFLTVYTSTNKPGGLDTQRLLFLELPFYSSLRVISSELGRALDSLIVATEPLWLSSSFSFPVDKSDSADQQSQIYRPFEFSPRLL
ncbi:hypothetical protein AXFE_23850 [Acidithrix ferrooxidans]|uniref:Uncharacterized protein n=1 Tax=Acidithrix ferrooxidans TaxID=1280514 RepID=A0A0D8HFI0_9ACTN|nr:hypothetical protein AXFE_23850 [Acidithrix ferrooxidans]